MPYKAFCWLILNLEDIGQIPIVAFTPQLRTGFGVEQSGIHLYPNSRALTATEENIENTHLLRDFTWVGFFGFQRKCRTAVGHKETAQFGQRSDNVFR